MRKILIVWLLLILIFMPTSYLYAEGPEPYHGMPTNVILSISDLDESGNLIYAGIDFAVFQDEDKDGIFKVKVNKVRRFITKHVSITVDLGRPADYKKGVVHKLAMRTLYISAGPKGNGAEEIIIADYNNGKEGWVLIPNSEFIPTYFADQGGNPFVRHTEKWDENRLRYNASKLSIGHDFMVRSYGTFWSGEKFKLNIKTTEVVPAVRVSIENTDYSKTLSVSEITASGGGIYLGELWDNEMLNKWGNYIPKELTFIIEAIDGSDVLETIEVKVTVDNRDLYYRIKREF